MTPVITSITRSTTQSTTRSTLHARTIARGLAPTIGPLADRLPGWRRALLCLPLVLIAASAQASNASSQPAANTPTKLWRCVDAASGQIGYSQQPCRTVDGASGQAMQVQDDRTRTQQRQSMDNQLRDLKLARAMRGERLHQERIARLDKPVSMSGKGKPHVIKSTPNDHRPVPISDSTRPIKVKAPKAEKAGKALPGGKMEAPIATAP